MTKQETVLAAFHASPPLKLCLLWAATMFCYIYGDYFGLFLPGRLAEMDRGIIGPLGAATPSVLLGVTVMMIVPSVMVFLPLVLTPRVNRVLNSALGAAYSGIMLATMPGAPPFYLLFGVVEVALTLAIVWFAWRWPRVVSA